MTEQPQPPSYFQPVTGIQPGDLPHDATGHGIAYWRADEDGGGTLLYWGQVINWQYIAFRTVAKLLYRIGVWVLGIIVGLGIGLGLWALSGAVLRGTLFRLQIVPWKFQWNGWVGLTGDWRMIIFWLAVILATLLVYIIIRHRQQQQAVLTRGFRADTAPRRWSGR